MIESGGVLLLGQPSTRNVEFDMRECFCAFRSSIPSKRTTRCPLPDFTDARRNSERRFRLPNLHTRDRERIFV
jgi:hypothetical protein